jgi:cysteine desulfurase/selenocysteine lyase
MLGPTGIGVLWVKKEILEKMPVFLSGGEMVMSVDFESSTYNYTPWRFEAGTPNIEGAVGLAAAVNYLTKIGMKNIRSHEEELTIYALERLKNINRLKIYGTEKIEKRAGVISFNIVNEKGEVAVHPHDLASILDGEGIAIRSGQLCAEPLMKVLGITASARVSFYFYNTKEEVDKLPSAIEKAKEIFRVK